ncbi:MAG: cyanophycinase [Verrucomicrobiaceae bacterium]|nr:cyanophycinase [Verrucomicrobiaceae bacterium]
MRFPFSFILCACFFAFPLAAAASERIDPAGINGSLVLSGAGLSDEGIDRFNELAGGRKMQVVVLLLDTGKSTMALGAGILARCEEEDLPVPVLVSGDQDQDAGQIIAAINRATGVWLLGQDGGAIRDGLASMGLRDSVSTVMNRGGVVGGCGAGCSVFAADGLSLLPGAIIAVHDGEVDEAFQLDKVLRKRPFLVGYEIGRSALLVVRGRRLTVAGKGAAVISLAAATGRKARRIVLKGRDAVADLSALRFAALARSREAFPANNPPSPVVTRGALIIIGGGAMPQGIVAEFIEKAGGDKASIVVLPTAMPDPVAEKSSIADAFRRAGAEKVTVLTGRTLKQVESDEYLGVLGKATGIWFGGGRQWRFADAYLDTRALDLMHDILARGGVIMGSSAGASIQADYLARANPLGNREIIAEGYERGLGFIKGVAIDQHFSQRKRFKDMSLLVTRYPQLLGIGIDEGTALIVEGEVGRISGKGSVHFYDRRKPVTKGEPDYESVHGGGRYQLVKRVILDPGKP